MISEIYRCYRFDPNNWSFLSACNSFTHKAFSLSNIILRIHLALVLFSVMYWTVKYLNNIFWTVWNGECTIVYTNDRYIIPMPNVWIYILTGVLTNPVIYQWMWFWALQYIYYIYTCPLLDIFFTNTLSLSSYNCLYVIGDMVFEKLSIPIPRHLDLHWVNHNCFAVFVYLDCEWTILQQFFFNEAPIL